MGKKPYIRWDDPRRQRKPKHDRKAYMRNYVYADREALKEMRAVPGASEILKELGKPGREARPTTLLRCASVECNREYALLFGS